MIRPEAGAKVTIDPERVIYSASCTRWSKAISVEAKR
ncbi:hypothetical protein CYOC110262_26250 [Cytobacillus oceanisediminis]